MIEIKIDFTWKQYVAVIGSIIIFSAIAYCIIDDPNETRENLQKTISKATSRSIQIK